jgi:hypothetical protein
MIPPKIDIAPLSHVGLKQKRRCTLQGNGIFEIRIS